LLIRWCAKIFLNNTHINPMSDEPSISKLHCSQTSCLLWSPRLEPFRRGNFVRILRCSCHLIVYSLILQGHEQELQQRGSCWFCRGLREHVILWTWIKDLIYVRIITNYYPGVIINYEIGWLFSCDWEGEEKRWN